MMRVRGERAPNPSFYGENPRKKKKRRKKRKFRTESKQGEIPYKAANKRSNSVQNDTWRTSRDF